MADQEFKILITADASSAVAATQQTGAGLDQLKKSTSDLATETTAAGKTHADLAREMGVITVTSDDLEAALKKTGASADVAREGIKKEGEAAHEAHVPHRELKESIRTLTRDYPELGEAARAALEPIVLAAFGIAEAFTIWNERMATAQSLLGGWQLPDFKVHAVGVSASAEAYDKLKTALQGANVEFNSGAAAFERQTTAINAQLGFFKQLIQAQKDKAIADLDLERMAGKLTPGMYDARKSIIEKGYNEENAQAEKDARTAELATKREAAKKIADESAEAAAKAAKIQPGLNDEGLEELITKAHSGADAAKQQTEANRERAKLAKEQGETQGVDTLTFSGWARALEFSKTFGAVTDPEEAAKTSEEAAKNAESTQVGMEELAKKLEHQRDERKRLNEEAAAKAAQAEKMQLELKGEDDPNKVGSTAWQNSATDTVTRSRNDTGAENRATKDIENFNKDVQDVQTYARATDPAGMAKANAAFQDMKAMLGDVIAAVNQLAAHHEDTSELKREVELMKRTIRHISSK